MSLLFDANLSPRLVNLLCDIYAGSIHVFDCGEIAADDRLIWQFASARGLVIVSKDSDFQAMSLLLGHPPKVIRLRVGNCPSRFIENLLRKSRPDIDLFLSDASLSLLVLDA